MEVIFEILRPTELRVSAFVCEEIKEREQGSFKAISKLYALFRASDYGL